MFDRTYIKGLARNRLRYGLGGAIAVLLIGLLLGAVESANLNIRFNYQIALVASVIIILVGILVSNVLKVGIRGWFLRYWRGEQPPVGEMFAYFRFYGNAVGTMLLRDIYIFLWSLLFIIPGIVKAYAYSMTEYILYENPRLSAGEAIRISNAMTQGFKGELFVFDLSFILWNLLSAISLGIAGVVYVNPYVYTAHAGMYEMIKDNALRSGRVRWEDFGLMPPSVPGYGW